MTSSDQSRQAFDIFDRACDLAGEDRETFLREACEGNPDLRREVDSLLAHDHEDGAVQELESGGAVDALAIDVQEAESSIPSQIGPYRIQSEIGSGGMGVIYAAEQESPRRRVALKLIRPGAMSPEVIRRFRHEAHVLGQLQHPGIAQIFEAGFAGEGAAKQPFLAMELIDGTRLDQYVDASDLDLDDRMELVARIADAVQHAHQKGVIHRDLKPANILVVGGSGSEAGAPPEPASSTHDLDAIGQPKVLDFGIARVTDEELDARTMHTQAGQLIGTLAYMSPEQVAGRSEGIDTRSDVYSLGVILFEILTGRAPYEVANLSLSEAVRVLERTDPPRAGSIDPALRGDAEAILARAMEKDRDERYTSAAELAADIRRSLRDEPILARPASTGYYLRKFMLRHRVLVAAAAVLLIVLAIGVTGTALGFFAAKRANADLAKANVTLKETNEKLGDANNALGDANDALEVTNRALDESLAEARRQADNARAVIAFLDEDLLATVRPSDEAGRGRDVPMRDVLDEASRRIGLASKPGGRFEAKPLIEATVRVSIGGSYRALGLYDQASPHLERCCALRLAELGEEHIDTIRAQMEMAHLDRDRADYGESLSRIERQIELLESSDDEDAPKLLWRARSIRGTVASRLDPAGAIELLQAQYDEAREELGENHDTTVAAKNNLGTVLAQRGRFDEAASILKEVYEHNALAMGKSDPRTLAAMMSYAHVLTRMGRASESVELLHESYERHVEVFGPGHPDTMQAVATLGNALRRLQRSAAAVRIVEPAVEVGSGEIAADHPTLLVAKQVLGDLYADLHRFDEAIAVLEEAYEIAVRTLGLDNAVAGPIATSLGNTYLSAGRYEQAETILAACHEIELAKLGPDHPNTYFVGLRLGRTRAFLGKFTEAEPLLLDAYERAAKRYPGHPALRNYAAAVRKLYELWNEAEPSEERAEALELWRQREKG